MVAGAQRIKTVVLPSEKLHSVPTPQESGLQGTLLHPPLPPLLPLLLCPFHLPHILSDSPTPPLIRKI